MSIWAIGDVHGCAAHLKYLLQKLPMQPEDQVLFLGDLIDRGPDTPGVLELIRSLQTKRDVIVLRGNHEVMILEARKNAKALSQWAACGGEATLDAYQASTFEDIPDADWSLIEASLPYHETETAIYLHASFDPYLQMKDQSESDLYWRFCDDPAPHISGKFVVCGHTLQNDDQPKLWKRVVCIDTLDPPKQNWLTAVNLEKRAFWQVNARGDIRAESFTALHL